jgi:hypothetical protein
MKKAIYGFAALVLTACLAPQALAQATRTWVSGVGDDANPCSRTAPCKTFAGAISKTATGGVIMVLDPGGFGGVTITKSITIDGSGGSNAGVLVSGTNAIIVNAPADSTVVIRNLSLEGIGTGLIGVNVIAGGRVLVEKCHIYGFRGTNGAGIRMGGSGTITVSDSTIHDNVTGVVLNATTGAVLATLDRVLIEDSGGPGISVSGAGYKFLNVLRSTINANAGAGVETTSGQSYVNLIDNMISFNGGPGVNANASGALVRISGNTLVNNNNMFAIAAGATIASDQSNKVAGGGPAPNGQFLRQ